jgi:predicted amidohydrolase YtcJ
MIRSGVTAVHDAACSPEAEALFGAMAAAGALPVSVLAMPHPSALLRNDHDTRLDGAPSGAGDERFRIGAFKLFADGGIAIALDVTLGGHRIQHGYLMDDLETCARRAADRGFRIAVHAIGNVGVEHALATFRSVARAHPGVDHRFRLEHAGVTSPAQWRVAADLGVVGVVQPGFVEHVGISSQGVRFDEHHWLAFGGLHEAGVVLAGSSDDPCAPFPPLWCIDRGMTRTTSTGIVFEPDQALPFADWLHAYTLGAAYAGGQENERGSITAGKVADFVELAESGTDRSVVATWVRGVREASIDPTT